MKGTYIEMKEEIAIVTGSNRGIGFACVKESVSLGIFTFSPEVDWKSPL